MTWADSKFVRRSFQKQELFELLQWKSSGTRHETFSRLIRYTQIVISY
jgi:hypothetical protein